MQSGRQLKNPIFLDIETVPSVSSYDQLDERLQKSWLKKAARLGKETLEEQKALFSERGGIFAEFGKVIVACIGYIAEEGENHTLHIKSLYGHDEKTILKNLKSILEKFFTQNSLQLCAHNGREFDFPYLCRRMIIHGIRLPRILDTRDKKPWQVNHMDTMDMWKFGDWKSYTSLDTLGALLGVPSSKDDMQGDQVSMNYYEKDNLDGIVTYCRKDLISLVQIFRKLSFLPTIKEDAIKHVA